jgi:hypothetical protein
MKPSGKDALGSKIDIALRGPAPKRFVPHRYMFTMKPNSLILAAALIAAVSQSVPFLRVTISCV